MRVIETETKKATPHVRAFVNRHRERMLKDMQNQTQKEYLLQAEKRRQEKKSQLVTANCFLTRYRNVWSDARDMRASFGDRADFEPYTTVGTPSRKHSRDGFRFQFQGSIHRTIESQRAS